MTATRNNLRAAIAAFTVAVIVLLPIILLVVRPITAYADDIQISFTPVVTCYVNHDGSVRTPDPESYCIKNEGTGAVTVGNVTLDFNGEPGPIGMSAKAAVHNGNEDNNVVVGEFDWFSYDKKGSFVQQRTSQNLKPNESLWVKLSIEDLSSENANVLDQVANGTGYALASVNYSFEQKADEAFAVIYNGQKSARVYSKNTAMPSPGDTFQGVVVDDVIPYMESTEYPFKQSGYNETLERVDIMESGIQLTGCPQWFYGCKKLTGIYSLNRLQCYNMTSTMNFFGDCEALENVMLTGFSTGNVADFSHMFDGCKSITTITDLYVNSSATDTSYMFNNCTKLTKFPVSNSTVYSSIRSWNVQNVTNMSNMFNCCISLVFASDTVGYWNVSNVTDMSGMFSGCASTRSIECRDWNVSNVTDMSGMFEGCSNLGWFSGKDWKPVKLASTRNMFKGCYRMEACVLNNWNSTPTSDVSGMFEGCSSLVQSNKKYGLQMVNWQPRGIKQASRTFANCWNLKELDLLNWDFYYVEDMSYMFYNCSSLEKFYMLGDQYGQTPYLKNISYMFYNYANNTEFFRNGVGIPWISTARVEEYTNFINTDGAVKQIWIGRGWTLNLYEIFNTPYYIYCQAKSSNTSKLYDPSERISEQTRCYVSSDMRPNQSEAYQSKPTGCSDTVELEPGFMQSSTQADSVSDSAPKTLTDSSSLNTDTLDAGCETESSSTDFDDSSEPLESKAPLNDKYDSTQCSNTNFQSLLGQ